MQYYVHTPSMEQNSAQRFFSFVARILLFVLGVFAIVLAVTYAFDVTKKLSLDGIVDKIVKLKFVGSAAAAAALIGFLPGLLGGIALGLRKCLSTFKYTIRLRNGIEGTKLNYAKNSTVFSIILAVFFGIFGLYGLLLYIDAAGIIDLAFMDKFTKLADPQRIEFGFGAVLGIIAFCTLLTFKKIYKKEYDEFLRFPIRKERDTVELMNLRSDYGADYDGDSLVFADFGWVNGDTSEDRIARMNDMMLYDSFDSTFSALIPPRVGPAINTKYLRYFGSEKAEEEALDKVRILEARYIYWNKIRTSLVSSKSQGFKSRRPGALRSAIVGKGVISLIVSIILLAVGLLFYHGKLSDFIVKNLNDKIIAGATLIPVAGVKGLGLGLAVWGLFLLIAAIAFFVGAEKIYKRNGGRGLAPVDEKLDELRGRARRISRTHLNRSAKLLREDAKAPSVIPSVDGGYKGEKRVEKETKFNPIESNDLNAITRLSLGDRRHYSY